MPTTPTSGPPGVSVNVSLLAPQPAASAISPSLCGFIGEHWRGPSLVTVSGTTVTDVGGTGPTQLCNSWSDFLRLFGGFNPNSVPLLANPFLAYSIYEYFANGGSSCEVARVTNSTTPGQTAAVTLNDGSATPQATLKLLAGALGTPGNAGTWGNSLFWAVTAQAVAGRFNLTLYSGSVTNANVLETWSDLSMSPLDSRYAPALINSPTAGSNYVYAIDMSDRDIFPVNMPAVGNGQFSGGVDPADPANQDYINAVTFGAQNIHQQNLGAFDTIVGDITFNMPGLTSTTVVNAAVTYSSTRPYTFFVIDPPQGETPTSAVSFFQSLSPTVANAAMYSGWQNTINPASANLRQNIWLPPGGFVLGQMVSTDTAAGGPWKAPAGIDTILANVVQAERVFSPNDLAVLNNANVNALRTLPNGRVVIWGDRTMVQGYATYQVHVQRTINYISAFLASALEPFTFQPNDAGTWSSVVGVCNSFLNGLLSAGAFPSTQPSQAFYVICDATNNTPQSISQGILNVTVGVALLQAIEFIVLNIQQFQSTGQVTVATT